MAGILRPSTALLDRMRRQRSLGDTGGVSRAVDSMAKVGINGSSAGVVVVRKTFSYQSYFDSTLMERGILTQPPAEPIVPSTKTEESTAGFGVGLHSASESPVAIQLLLGGGRSGSSTFVLRPGEVFRSKQRFDGIRYGLPFGWLGGGTVQIRILQNSADHALFVGAGGETLFHRVRLPVFAVGDNPLVTAAGVQPNWPLQFPWSNAFDLNGSQQKGQPLLVVDPSKLVVRLRKAPLAGGARMRLLILKSDDLDLQSDGATYDGLGTSGSWVDFQWPAIAASGFRIGGTTTAEFPVMSLNAETVRIGGPSAIAVFIDMDGTIGNTAFVDIERYGII